MEDNIWSQFLVDLIHSQMVSNFLNAVFYVVFCCFLLHSNLKAFEQETEKKIYAIKMFMHRILKQTQVINFERLLLLIIEYWLIIFLIYLVYLK